MSLLVIGKTGQVARALAYRAADRRIEIERLGRPEFDLEAVDANAIASRRPRVVINAAAYTAVDKAENDADRAFKINAGGPEAVARAAVTAGARVIHVSTDYVFAGDKAGAYVETDETGPTGVYGRTKLQGESAVLRADPRAVVVRTAWVYDATGANFVRTMLRLAKTRPEISVVADQVGCPTYAPDLADALLAIAETSGPAGIYHAAGTGSVSWAEFAEEVFTQAAARGGPSARVLPIPTSAYPTQARRPANSRLDCSKLDRDYSIRLRPWREALGACLDEIAADGWRVE